MTRITLPEPREGARFLPEVFAALRAGDGVLLSGVLYTARDAAHLRLCELLDAGEPLPIEIDGTAVYYAGPTPPPPGAVIGSVGPTTSSRMDFAAPRLIRLGLLCMIGKGARSAEVREAIKERGAVYLAAAGGAGALLGERVVSAETVAFPELGAEAIRRLVVRDFPATVAIDSAGRDLYAEGRASYLDSIK
ncbi:MAG: FumA C-terminus/TtdB family hydratase beta subunit [Oscillospiraceae bacterium]|jgi:fumarate hydratase subunit beta|nr:FumA C-terminus/TtdB family hydratase beta subunit [Oscillospiraceae bacterium]